MDRERLIVRFISKSVNGWELCGIFNILFLMAIDSDPVMEFRSASEWEEWLKNEHNISKGVWLKFAKKGTGITTVNYQEALDVALCWGWIDGISRRLDETYYLQRFTPRGKRSMWSKINVEKVAALINARRMMPAGLAEVERAKTDGRWERAYASPKNIVMHNEFAQALKNNKKAAAFYESLNKTKKYPFLFRVQEAKKPETRMNRIKKYIILLEEGKTL